MLYSWILLGILLSASAQLGLRLLADQNVWGIRWMAGMGTCVLFYGGAFLVYSYLLRHHRITVIGPVMTIGVVLLVVLGGVLLGENLSSRQIVGGVLAILSLWFLLV